MYTVAISLQLKWVPGRDQDGRIIHTLLGSTLKARLGNIPLDVLATKLDWANWVFGVAQEVFRCFDGSNHLYRVVTCVVTLLQSGQPVASVDCVCGSLLD